MNAVHEQEVIAFHEAAHATVACHFGHPVLSVQVGGGSGRCVLPREFEVKPDRATSEDLIKREATYQVVIGWCAGRAAMRRLHGKERFSDDGWKNSDDYRRAFAHCLRLSGGDEVEAQLLLDWLGAQTNKLSGKERPRITKID